ncbi:hypothetical protein GCM10011360_17740 [Primorskyibacter flagellatus]|uniref:Helix-turn-helix domain-containing protein n=1 Tax=Primorskyibacter flagellatus TaxID=1387277 RepID=A0A917EE28_9RHOB|nr:hypothetical protein [Primorskyibacter flagellatus]GGE30129.1 hypothetical protein GCM10011360_17740 [Primorskyibacter flagellatus]
MSNSPVDQATCVRRRSGYTSVPNAVMSDTRLSIEARGLLALLMTFREGWVFRPNHLMEQCRVGRDKYYRMVGELKDLGYVSVVQTKTEKGEFLGTYWEINDNPCPENPYTGEPDTGEPDSGKTAHIRETNLLRETKDKTPIPPEGDLFSAESKDRRPEPDLIGDGFKEFWETIWPSHQRKTGRRDCEKVYRQACEGKHPKAEKVSPADLNAATRRYVSSVQDRQYLKGPLPWLRQPGWEPFLSADEPDRPKSYARRVLEAQKSGRLV